MVAIQLAQPVTEQWLSIALPGRGDPPLPSSAQTEGRWQILVQQRHRRKLKRGFHQANRFTIRLRELDGDHDQIEARLLVLKASGVSPTRQRNAQPLFGHREFVLQAGEPDVSGPHPSPSGQFIHQFGGGHAAFAHPDPEMLTSTVKLWLQLFGHLKIAQISTEIGSRNNSTMEKS